jgi:hypothetical protein
MGVQPSKERYAAPPSSPESTFITRSNTMTTTNSNSCNPKGVADEPKKKQEPHAKAVASRDDRLLNMKECDKSLGDAVAASQASQNSCLPAKVSSDDGTIRRSATLEGFRYTPSMSDGGCCIGCATCDRARRRSTTPEGFRPPPSASASRQEHESEGSDRATCNLSGVNVSMSDGGCATSVRTSGIPATLEELRPPPSASASRQEHESEGSDRATCNLSGVNVSMSDGGCATGGCATCDRARRRSTTPEGLRPPKKARKKPTPERITIDDDSESEPELVSNFLSCV